MVSSDAATPAEEEYLQIMFWLEEAGLPITGANVARAMQLSAPTVHEMVGRLERDGYVERATDKSLRFTPEGRQQASAIVRRHRLIERFLTDILGIPWDEVHEEAERLEHAMSPVLEERMLAAVGDARTCPHGHPLTEGEREQGALLADVERGAAVLILRFENEAEELLHYLKEVGLHPGLEGTVERSADDGVVVSSDRGRHTVSRSVAETVSVRADPSPAPRPPLPEQLVLSSDRYGRLGRAPRPTGRSPPGSAPRERSRTTAAGSTVRPRAGSPRPERTRRPHPSRPARARRSRRRREGSARESSRRRARRTRPRGCGRRARR